MIHNNKIKNFFTKLCSKEILFIIFLSICSIRQQVQAQGVIPVYVHDYESIDGGHSEYTDENIVDLICELNHVYATGGTCTYEPTDIRFALEGITRSSAGGYGGSGQTPTDFMYKLLLYSSPSPYYAVHIYLYDFGGTSAIGAYLAGSGHMNTIHLKKTGFNIQTLTHEVGHMFGLDHVSPTPGASTITLQNLYSSTSCGAPTESFPGVTSSTNYMDDGGGSGRCYFTTKQVDLMKCNFNNRWKPSYYPLHVAHYGALLIDPSYTPAHVVFNNSGANSYWATIISPTTCPTWITGYSYSIFYCDVSGPSFSPCDVINAPTTGGYIPIAPCQVGTLVCSTHHGSYINVSIRSFDTRSPGCVTSCYCTFNETSKTTPNNEIAEISNDEIYIYPTVTTDKLNIKSSLDIDKYTIFEITGKIIKIDDFNKQIDVSELPSGNYLLRLSSNAMSKTLRFTKQ